MPDLRFTVALVFTLPGAAFAQVVPPTDSLVMARIDSLMAANIEPDGPGCTVGLGRPDRPPILRARGHASLEYGVSLTPETILDAASLAKQFTAAAVVLLASQGKLSLDDDVRRYVPELPRYDGTITLRHLIHHTSGLRDQWDLLWLSGGLDDDATEEDDVLGLLARQRRLNFTPGSAFLYSNSGYTLLAVVVRRVSGISLREYVAKEIFEPLGMTSTFFLDDRFRVLHRVASGYRKARPGAGWGRSAYLRDVYGSGGLFTTASDLLRWYDALNRGTLANGALLKAAERPGTLATGDSIGYSMGLEVGTLRSRRYFRHGGNDLGASAYAMHLPDDHVSVVALCNGRELDAFTLARQTLEPFLPPPTATPGSATATVPSGALPSAAELRSYAGIYYNPSTLATRVVELREGRLYWVRGGGATPLEPVAARRFRFPPGQPAELEFPARRPGGPQEMRVISGGGITPYQQAEPFAAPGGLLPYTGAYSSEELGVTLWVTEKEGRLEIGTAGSWRFQVQPIFRDAFAIPEAVVLRFTRDARGRISGFVADLARSRGITFRKVQSPG